MRYAKRKWGYYLTLISRKQFKVKLLYFRRYAKCSMQRHELRNELWLFLFGRGTMQLSRQYPSFSDLKSGDWTRIRRNAWHQFVAIKRTLVLEIQYGDNCQEEDIIRDL